jgi:hypothetical protein
MESATINHTTEPQGPVLAVAHEPTLTVRELARKFGYAEIYMYTKIRKHNIQPAVARLKHEGGNLFLASQVEPHIEKDWHVGKLQRDLLRKKRARKLAAKEARQARKESSRPPALPVSSKGESDRVKYNPARTAVVIAASAGVGALLLFLLSHAH